MSLFFLFLGFAVGAAFYVVAGRGPDDGGLGLPQRLGLVVAVGLVLGLAGQMFVRQSEQELQQAIERDRAQRGAAGQLEQDASREAAAKTADSGSPAAEAGNARRDLARDATTGTASESSADRMDRGPDSGPGTSPGSEPMTSPAQTSAQVASPAETPPSARSEPPPPTLQPSSTPSETAPNCAYSPDTERCVCVNPDGSPARVPLEECKALATAGSE